MIGYILIRNKTVSKGDPKIYAGKDATRSGFGTLAQSD